MSENSKKWHICKVPQGRNFINRRLQPPATPPPRCPVRTRLCLVRFILAGCAC
ncbi:MAG: hypothetical protein LBD59_06155 [Prevotellaceae bacterium]|nr:hypothetical protein [Prevotellaceae bacterium]